MVRQISLVLSFLILGVFLNVGILSAEEAITAIKDSAKTAAVTANETEKTPEAGVPQEGISVNDLEGTVKSETPEPAPASASKEKQMYFQETTEIPENQSSVKSNQTTDSKIVSKGWKGDGKIVGDKDKKMMISAGDTVYVDIGNDRVNKGDICCVYRNVGRVKDKGEVLGYEVRLIGKIEITDNSNSDASSAKVFLSFEPINIGDIVKIGQTEE